MTDLPIDHNEIVITASRTAEEASRTPASVTVIDERRTARLGEPLVPALLRVAPSAAVAASGPAGSLTEVRIRGAENNHTLLFLDGIRINDPASGNQPRFELLNADMASRIEVVRGPQSALWGSEAIGGVIAIDGAATDAPTAAAAAEAGSFGLRRVSASGALKAEHASLSLALGWQRAAGIDSFDRTGDRDGYRNLSGRVRGSWRLSPLVELSASALALTGKSEFDGFDPVTFRHADTLDSSRNRLLAGKLAVRIGKDGSKWGGRIESSLLGSTNRNFLAGDELNRTRGRRWTVGGQVEHRFSSGAINHRLVAAADYESESFRAHDTAFGGFTNQDRSRYHQALTFEWRAETDSFVADVALRRDRFSRFKDATTVRASALANIGRGFSLAGSYGEGIAQPSFYDLYGFFPGNFLGNPNLKPESSRGVEASVRYRHRGLSAALTWYRQRLHDEIVDVFDDASGRFTTANRGESSRRSGVEVEFGWQMGADLRLSANYAYLRATEPQFTGAQVREVRRPKHSGAIGADGQHGRLTYGLSIAYTGARVDTDFEVFPFRQVRLNHYWLAGARVAYDATPGVQLFVRAANAFDDRYQDAFGYRTEGRSLYAGVRLVPRR